MLENNKIEKISDLRKNLKKILNETGKTFFRTTHTNSNTTVGKVELVELKSDCTYKSDSKIAYIYISVTRDDIKSESELIKKSGIPKSQIKNAIEKSNFPVVFIYASLKEPNDFYFCDFKTLFNGDLEELSERKQDKFLIKIPVKNKFSTNSNDFFRIINA